MSPELAALQDEIDDLLREKPMLLLARDRFDQETENLTAQALNAVALAAMCEGIYTGAERALLLIAREIDRQPIEKADQWHKALIDRMASPFGSRPAVLAPDTAALMNDLRSFRHKVRSHYGAALDSGRVRDVSLLTETFVELVAADLSRLMKA